MLNFVAYANSFVVCAFSLVKTQPLVGFSLLGKYFWPLWMVLLTVKCVLTSLLKITLIGLDCVLFLMILCILS